MFVEVDVIVFLMNESPCECYALKQLMKSLTAFLFFQAMVLIFMRHDLLELYRFAASSNLFSYILTIPFISAFFFFKNYKHIFGNTGFSVIPGVSCTMVGFILYFAGHHFGAELSKNDYLFLSTIAWLLMSLGGFIIFFGWHAFKRALFPLLFLFFMAPIPSSVLNNYIGFLQKGSEEVSFLVFRLLGVPIWRQGNVFQLPDFTFEVARECSGIRSSIGLWITALLFSYTFLKSNVCRFLALLAVIPIAIFKNGLRIVTLGLLASYVDPIYITNHWLHKSGGILYFTIALLFLFFPLLFLLRLYEGRKKLGIKQQKKQGI